jgi:ribonuclease PH
MREIKITKGEVEAEGSVYLVAQNTKILATASIENKVPQFLKGQGEAWVKVQYWMHPRAVIEWKPIDMRIKDSRAIEISRIIGRVLRASFDRKIGEFTFFIDCEVLSADGSTRVHSVNASCCALIQAINFLKKQNLIKIEVEYELVAGISVGIIEGKIVTDLTYTQDFSSEFDLNIFFTEKGKLIEIQGTSEKRGINSDKLREMIEIAQKEVKKIFEIQREFLKKYPYVQDI